MGTAHFDFFCDPLPDWMQDLAAVNLPRPLLLAVGTCLAGLALCALVATGERERVEAALVEEQAAGARYAVAQAQLADVGISADEATNLLALESSLREIRKTGYTYAQLFDAAAVDLPTQAWIAQVNPAGDGGADLIGGAKDLETIAKVANVLGNGRFGNTGLRRVTRVRRSGDGTHFEFALHLERP